MYGGRHGNGPGPFADKNLAKVATLGGLVDGFGVVGGDVDEKGLELRQLVEVGKKAADALALQGREDLD